jgi:DivIVA domain-containing protein
VIKLLEVLAVLAVVFSVAVVLTGRTEGLSDEGRDLADTGIPRDRAMTAEDVVRLRFALAFRGYRMAEVDDALDRLAAELAARDDLIAQLRATEDAQDAEPEVVEPEPEPEPEAVAPEPEPAPEPAPEVVAPEPEPVTAQVEEPPAPNPFRPEVPDIPTYDPWSVTPRSRYTDGPTYVEVEHPDEPADVDAIGAHQTGYAPAPAEERPAPPWAGAASATPAETTPDAPAGTED